ncbi:MAG TPA: MarR family winged helix-turn-helix transcriptional regulator [Terriglobales bacterium]|nr:MarR family winged helix-turn-helix transcriptional regulator [Terriglobales bacterium]
MQRLFRNYPKIYLACHRQHLHDVESGRTLSSHLSSILDHLDAQHPLTISDLARHLSVTESTMSIHISKLERFGYVRRGRDDRDKRCRQVQLTAAGNRIREQSSVLDPDLAREMMSLLRPNEAEAALSGLELLGKAADRLLQKRRLRRRKSAK